MSGTTEGTEQDDTFSNAAFNVARVGKHSQNVRGLAFANARPPIVDFAVRRRANSTRR